MEVIGNMLDADSRMKGVATAVVLASKEETGDILEMALDHQTLFRHSWYGADSMAFKNFAEKSDKSMLAAEKVHI